MKVFIEVTDLSTEKKLCFAVEQIKGVLQEENSAPIILIAQRYGLFGKKTKLVSYRVEESYDEVVAKIKAATTEGTEQGKEIVLEEEQNK